MNTQLGFLIVSLLLWRIKASATTMRSRSCQHTCGNVSVDYPFGIGKDCYFNDWFEVTCNSSAGTMKPFLKRMQFEILEIIGGTAPPTFRVNTPVISSGCGKNNTAGSVNLSGTPFYFSNHYNRLITVMNCSNSSTLMKQNDSVIHGCSSICNGDQEPRKEGCYGFNCCQTTIPSNRKYFNFPSDNTNSQECRSAIILDQTFISDNRLNSKALIDNLLDPKALIYVPAVLEMGTYIGDCINISSNSSNAICNSKNGGDCWMPLRSGLLCHCATIDKGYCNGNKLCVDNSCSQCDLRYYSPYDKNCYPIHKGIFSPKVKIIIGCISGGLGMLLLLIGGWWFYKFGKRRREIELKQKFFKRNGGLLLQQELSSNKGNVDKIKLCTSKELEKATDNYNTNRILGEGGQGTVYKGMLVDGRIVAIKKSKKVDKNKIKEFINEMVILSQINHRNVVKLLGYCLETEVPLLVYEFIPNGALSQYIHNQTEEFPITWEMRLRIATEVSGALSYLHSAASKPIYHRDIKSTNILLDDKYRAKVSDFGISRSVMANQTHLTTQVQGTFRYFDPEYFRSSQFTEKSDVYNFGVVLVELLTGQKPIRSTNFEEDTSLVAYFLSAMKENHLFEVLDTRVLKEERKEEIIAVAKLAKICLKLNGKKRPTMNEVATELLGIRASDNGDVILPQNSEEMIDYDDDFEPSSSFTETMLFLTGITLLPKMHQTV